MLIVTLVSLLSALTAAGARPAATRAQDDGLATAAFAPATSLLFAEANLDQDSAQFSQAEVLLDRAGLSSLLQQASDDALSERETGADLDVFLGGEVGFVVTSVAGAEGFDFGSVISGDTDAATSSASSGIAAVLRARDPEAAFTSLEEDLSASAEENGVEVQTIEHEGVTISAVEGIVDDEGEESSMALARVDDFILLAQGAADLEPLIDAQAGRVDSLADENNLAALQAELNDEYLLFAYLNGPALREAITAAADAQTQSLLGGNTLRAFDAYTGVVVWADEPGFRLDTISIPSEDAGPASAAGNFDATLDERVPGDTILFANGQDLGPSGLLDGVALLFAMGVTGMVDDSGGLDATPEASDPEEVFAQAEELVGFNIQTDLLDQLVGEFGIAVSLTDLLSPDGVGALFISGVEDPAVLSDTVSQIALLVASAVGGETEYSTREIDASTVNVVEDTSGTIPVRVEYGVVGEQFLVGFGNLLQTFVDGPETSLADNPQYQEVMALLPEEHGAVLYVDLAQVIGIVEALFGSFSSSGISDASPDCAEYDTREDAQAAFDEDPGSLINLDQDFDGEACEDFFAPEDATAEAETAATDFSAIKALATVQYGQDGLTGSRTIVYIEE